MSEFYVPCSFFNFCHFISDQIPNERGEYLLECGHAYSLYPPVSASDPNIFYLHILVPGLCTTNGHLQKIRDNLRYQFNNPKLFLTPYHRPESGDVSVTTKSKISVPYVTCQEPIWSHNSGEYNKMIHQLFLSSKQVILFEWKNNYYKPTRQNNITYYARVVTETTDCQVTFKNFWTGLIQDLPTALERKEAIEQQPLKYLKHLSVDCFQIQQPKQLLEQFLNYQFLDQFPDHLVKTILHYYELVNQDCSLPYPRLDSQQWKL